MNRRSIEALFTDLEGSIMVLSPLVGLFRSYVRHGDFLAPGAKIGDLSVLDLRYSVFIPSHISGVIDTSENFQKMYPVGYRSPLLTIRSDQLTIPNLKNENTISGTDEFKKNELIISAFTTGIFYTKPSPDAEPFVLPGSVVRHGSVLGLIEVMKSFNHIIFTGKDKHHEGKVVKILKRDSDEVDSGDPLFVISIN